MHSSSLTKNLQILFVKLFICFSFVLFAEPVGEQDTKPLLRVYPIFRREECEWAPRMDICWYCIKKNERYAQKIYFMNDKPYREHGCYTEKKGFYLIEK
jgi:hypothetical protein